MNVLNALWIVFSLIVVYSFGVMGLHQMSAGRPHVAAMAGSYSLLVVAVLVPETFASWIRVVALVLGVVGLIDYWMRTNYRTLS